MTTPEATALSAAELAEIIDRTITLEPSRIFLCKELIEASYREDIGALVPRSLQEAEACITMLADDRVRLLATISKRDERVRAWEETARLHATNEAFWRELVMETGRILGGRVYTQDDGGIVDRPLGLRVPEVASELVADLASLKSMAVSGDDRDKLLWCLRRLNINPKRDYRDLVATIDDILAAGFRRPLESSQTGTCPPRLTAGATTSDTAGIGVESTSLPSASPAEPSNGYLTGNNPNGGMVAKESIVGAPASPAEPVKVGEKINSVLSDMASVEIDWAACRSSDGTHPSPVKVAGREALADWLITMYGCPSSHGSPDEAKIRFDRDAERLLASGILPGRKLDREKVARVMAKNRRQHYAHVQVQSLTDTLCADIADIWTDE